MEDRWEIADAAGDTVVAYYDLEFCNEAVSRHNLPIAIGVSYRKGGQEIGSYDALIRYDKEQELWQEQLERIGYSQKMLRLYGKPMDEMFGDLLRCHETYQPKLYASFGRQDEDLLKKYADNRLSHWSFCDALRFLSERLGIKYDVSLENYAYICGISFVHIFDPLEDARALAEVVWHILQGQMDETRRQKVVAEYDKKLFLMQYQNKQKAYDALLRLPERTPRQQEKLYAHEAFLEQNKNRYLSYLDA